MSAIPPKKRSFISPFLFLMPPVLFVETWITVWALVHKVLSMGLTLLVQGNVPAITEFKRRKATLALTVLRVFPLHFFAVYQHSWSSWECGGYFNNPLSIVLASLTSRLIGDGISWYCCFLSESKRLFHAASLCKKWDL